ncbi:hypothetical protein AB0L53_51600 [Nonomuraea sp. NPDC052129]|uniref:hypothetical protein n=1 Tax=Nonomuraea sp. NPDC052129 TaxID=3154651 RepID=UPI0034256443
MHYAHDYKGVAALQRGPRNLWDGLEAAYLRWVSWGRRDGLRPHAPPPPRLLDHRLPGNRVKPLREMGAVALRTALRLAAGEKIESSHIELATRLVVRGSTLAV